ncbi:MAG: alpha/beta fold hydrolase [Thermoleophilaceae bacterium]
MLNHVRRGGGEPLVLIHPLGAELVVWEPVLDLLARARDVIAVDLPGFGGSAPLSNGARPTPPLLAGSVASFMDQLGIERAHVAGNSLGGWVALELAKAGRALSVTGVSTAGLWRRPLGPRPGGDVRRVGRVLLPLLPVLLRGARGRRLLLRGSVGYPERVPAAAASRLVRSYVTSPGFEGANAEMRAAVFSGVEQIRVPVTLAWAELDRLVRRPRETTSGWRTLVLRDCGHIPTWDDPEQVARVLLRASD